MDADAITSRETRSLAVPASPDAGPPSALRQPSIGQQVGRYTVLGCLGKGGMGAVYKAYDPQLDRNVALKVLHHVLQHDEHGSELRLLREAQMLAHLQHPNVVAVFDAGLTTSGVFIAMELVEGLTLRQWLAPGSCRVGEILEVFRAAGRGLAAVHEAGFVHRDFKPSNVIVSDSGTVRVLDFGIASLMDPQLTAHEPSGTTQLGSHPHGRRRQITRPPGLREPLSSSGVELTEDGVILGTPAYMAPEQIMGDKADHRSDQFMFCVCLHLALYGRSPVISEGFEERRWHMSQGRVLDERGMLRGRTAGRVPVRVRRALRRGLSPSPDARFASMDALVDALEDPPRRRSLTIASATLVAGIGVGALLFDADDPCGDPAAALDPVWNEDEHRAIWTAFTRSEHPHANELAERVEQQLDDYARAWTTMHAESCRATFVTRQQSEALHDQRLRCLGRRRNRMRSAIEALGRIAEPKEALDRMLLPFALPRVADCADLEALSAALPLPEDPAQRDRIVALRRALDEVETLEVAGDFRAGLELSRVVVEEARELRFSPLLGEALGHLGRLQVEGGSARQAQASLEASILEATRVGDDATAARSWTWLIHALVLQQRLELGHALEFAAWAAVERADLDEVRGWLLNNLGALYGRSNDVPAALDYLQQAIEVKRRTLGPDHVDVGISWFNLGTLLANNQRHSEAYAALERARSIFEATVGPAHPLAFHAIGGLCQVEHARGRNAEAIELCGRVLDHYELSPVSHVAMGRIRFLMAKALGQEGRLQEAKEHARRALDLVRAEDSKLAKAIEHWLAGSARSPARRRARSP